MPEISTTSGGFNSIEKYQSNWKSSPNRGETRKYLKPPPRVNVGKYTSPMDAMRDDKL